jgi:hypothetical protein
MFWARDNQDILFAKMSAATSKFGASAEMRHCLVEGIAVRSPRKSDSRLQETFNSPETAAPERSNICARAAK